MTVPNHEGAQQQPDTLRDALTKLADEWDESRDDTVRRSYITRRVCARELRRALDSAQLVGQQQQPSEPQPVDAPYLRDLPPASSPNAERLRALVLNACEDLGRHGLPPTNEAIAAIASLVVNASLLGRESDAAHQRTQPASAIREEFERIGRIPNGALRVEGPEKEQEQ